MRSIVFGLMMAQLIGVAAAQAQTGDEVQIEVSVFEVKTNGAEQAAGGAFASGLVSGKSSSGARFSYGPVAHSRSKRERKDRSQKAPHRPGESKSVPSA